MHYTCSLCHFYGTDPSSWSQVHFRFNFFCMKKILSLLFFAVAAFTAEAQIGLGVTTPHPNAYFQINSTTKGVLLPRMSALQRIAIAPAATANGLMVFDTDSSAYMFWTGTLWKKMGAEDGYWVKSGNDIYNSNTRNVGIGTGSPLAKLHVADSAVVFTGSVTEPAPSPGVTIPVQNAGTRMLWYPQKAAFRAGYVNGTNWNKENIGLFSVALGHNTMAAGDHSFAAGKSNYTFGISSFTLGENNIANGVYSAALGYGNAANGIAAQSLGWANQATGNYSMAVGSGNQSSGENSVALGSSNVSSGLVSLSSGYNSTASGNYSFAGGNSSESTGQYAFSFGNNNGANNSYAVAFGNSCISASMYGFTAGFSNTNNASTAFVFGDNNSSTFSANNALVVGSSCSASQAYGVAIGYNNQSQGQNAVAIGRNVRALSDNSFAFGLGSVTNAQGSFAVGNGNNTYGLNSFAMGESNRVDGESAFVGGVQNQAWGSSSFATGTGNMVFGAGAFVTGLYNDLNGYFDNASSPAATDRIFQLANGSNNFSRSNALTVLRNGKTGFGTTTPNATIHIDNNESQKLILEGADVNNNFGLGVFGFSELRMHAPMGSSVALGNGSVDNFTPRVFVDGISGNVGIGTTTPDVTLEVNGQVKINDGTQGANKVLTSDAVGTASWQPISSYWSANGGHIYNNNAGNVGIGNNTPIVPLSFASVLGSKISLWGSSTSNHYGMGIQPGLLQLYAASNVDDIAFGYGSSTSFTELVRIDGPTGNLGIGTSAPSEKLHVSGTASNLALFNGGNNLYITLSENGSPKGYIGSYNQSVTTNDVDFGTYGTTNGAVHLITQAIPRLTVSNGGNVGIGITNPTQALHVNGNILATGTITPSDIRFKKNIAVIQNPLEKIVQLHGVTYLMNRTAYPDWKFDASLQYGLIAQEVEKVFPEIVKEINGDGYKGVDYVKLVPVMLEAIKELDRNNNELKAEKQSLEQRIQLLEDKMNRLVEVKK